MNPDDRWVTVVSAARPHHVGLLHLARSSCPPWLRTQQWEGKATHAKVVQLVPNSKYFVRVLGVNADGRMGPPSQHTEVVTPQLQLHKGLTPSNALSTFTIVSSGDLTLCDTILWTEAAYVDGCVPRTVVLCDQCLRVM